MWCIRQVPIQKDPANVLLYIRVPSARLSRLLADAPYGPPFPLQTSIVGVHGPTVTLVQRLTRGSSMIVHPVDPGPLATAERASVSSDRSAQRDCRLLVSTR
jgi:hypothetical protein